MGSAASTFSELMTRASNGDLTAQESLCILYETEVLIAARVHLGPVLRSHLDSMDVTQSVHKSLIAGIVSGKFHFQDSRSLVALACLIARRKIAKKWRKHRRQLRLDSNDSSFPSNDLLLECTADSDTENRQRMHQESVDQLRESVSPGERILIDLRLSGLTSEQIAQQLGIDPVAVRVRWSRLAAKLRKSATEAVPATGKTAFEPPASQSSPPSLCQ